MFDFTGIREFLSTWSVLFLIWLARAAAVESAPCRLFGRIMRLRHHLLVYLFYLAVTLVITFPLITVIGTRMIGHPFGDAYEYTHHIWWIKTALQTGQNPFFMPNLVYPDGVSAPLLWSQPLQSFPAWLFAFVLPLPAAFNLAALLTLALNGWAMFFLVRYLLTQSRPSAPAGTSRLKSLPHQAGRRAQSSLTVHPRPDRRAGLHDLPGVSGTAWRGAHRIADALSRAALPLRAAAPARHARTSRRTMLGGALLFMVSLWGSVLLLIYLIAPITAIYSAERLAARTGERVRRALVTVMLGGIFALPFVVPLALDTLGAPLEAGVGALQRVAAGRGLALVLSSPVQRAGLQPAGAGADPFEQASYVGVIAAALALIGGLEACAAARWWLLLALVAWVFSLGPLLKVGRRAARHPHRRLRQLRHAALGAVAEPAADQHRAHARALQFRRRLRGRGAGGLRRGGAVGARFAGAGAALGRCWRLADAGDRLRVPVLVGAADHPRHRARSRLRRWRRATTFAQYSTSPAITRWSTKTACSCKPDTSMPMIVGQIARAVARQPGESRRCCKTRSTRRCSTRRAWTS